MMLVAVLFGSVTIITCAAMHMTVRLVRMAKEEDEANDPARIRAKRASIQTRRELLERRRSGLFTSRGPDGRRMAEGENSNLVRKVDEELLALAIEESSLPVLDEEPVKPVEPKPASPA